MRASQRECCALRCGAAWLVRGQGRLACVQDGIRRPGFQSAELRASRPSLLAFMVAGRGELGARHGILSGTGAGSPSGTSLGRRRWSIRSSL